MPHAFAKPLTASIVLQQTAVVAALLGCSDSEATPPPLPSELAVVPVATGLASPVSV